GLTGTVPVTPGPGSAAVCGRAEAAAASDPASTPRWDRGLVGRDATPGPGTSARQPEAVRAARSAVQTSGRDPCGEDGGTGCAINRHRDLEPVRLVQRGDPQADLVGPQGPESRRRAVDEQIASAVRAELRAIRRGPAAGPQPLHARS